MGITTPGPNAIRHTGQMLSGGKVLTMRRILAAIWPLLVRNNKDIQNQTNNKQSIKQISMGITTPCPNAIRHTANAGRG